MPRQRRADSARLVPHREQRRPTIEPTTRSPRHTDCKPHCLESEEHMKKAARKLGIRKQTIRFIVTEELAQANGGWIRPPITWSCPQPSASGCCPHTE
jgi:hypothetical protein